MSATLLAFLACEKVLIASDDNMASIISVLQGFTIREEIPELNGELIHVPQAWVYTLWERTGYTEPFEQKVELISSAGRSLVTQDATVTFTDDKRFVRVVVKTQAFPLDGSIGDYQAVLSVKTQPNDEFRRVAMFPIPIIVKLPEMPQIAAPQA